MESMANAFDDIEQYTSRANFLLNPAFRVSAVHYKKLMLATNAAVAATATAMLPLQWSLLSS